MTTIARRRPAPPSGGGYNNAGAKENQRFNKNLRYIQGFRTSIPAGGTVSQDIVLNAAGLMMLGLTFISSARTVDISDVVATMLVNNNSVLTKLCCANANPLDTQGMIFFPVPQELKGNDAISITFTNNSGLPVIILTNMFYVPR